MSEGETAISPRESLPHRSSKIPVLMFGNGPVLDAVTRTFTTESHTLPGGEDVPFWSHNLAEAAAILYKRNAAEQFFVMGGKTGGPQYASEAELISRTMTELGIPLDMIGKEEHSTDTPLNFVEFLNMYTAPDAKLDELTVDLLGASSHVHRLKVFAQLFALPTRHVFAAEEVMRFEARTNAQGALSGDSSEWDDDTLQRIENMLNISSQNDYFEKQQGLERNTSARRVLHDNLWVREVLQFPERMAPIIAQIKNDERVREMVHIQFVIHGEEAMNRLGVLKNDSVDELRQKLGGVQWPIHSDEEKQQMVAEWERENGSSTGWPQAVMDTYNRLINYKKGE